MAGKQNGQGKRQDARQLWLVGGTGVIVALMLIGISLSAKPGTGKAPTTPLADQPNTWTEPTDQKVMGNPAARVRLVEYGDYL